MAEILQFPKSKKLKHLHVAGYAILLVGAAMIFTGQHFADGALSGLFPLFD